MQACTSKYPGLPKESGYLATRFRLNAAEAADYVHILKINCLKELLNNLFFVVG